MRNTFEVATKIPVLCSVIVALFLGRINSAHADCGQIIVNATDGGWYDVTGFHSAANDNYFCGDARDTAASPVRNFFVFQVPSLTQQVVSAVLRVPAHTVATPNSETYQLREVITQISTLRASGGGKTNVYADLGDGTIYGSRVFTTSDSGQTVSVPLNNAFLSALAAATGGQIGLGGEISTLDGFPNDEYVFGFSGNATAVQLVLTLTNSNPLAITQHPASQNAQAGQNVTLYSDACGVSPLSFQWQRNSVNLPGRTSPFLILLNVTSNDAGSYRLIVTNSSGAVTSSVATLTVEYALPTATAYFQTPPPFFTGDNISMCVEVTGAPFPSKHWQLNGTNLPGQSSYCLYLNNVQPSQSGDYTVVVSNSVGVSTSAVLSVSISNRPPLYLYFSVGSSPLPVGNVAYLCAAGTATMSASFQWLFNGVEITNQTNSCFYIPEAGTNHSGLYSLVASNSTGIYTSAPIDLVVYYQPPTYAFVSVFGNGAAALLGNDVNMCVSHNGASPPISFQWRFNGTDLLNETQDCLSVVQINTNQAGEYSVVVSNPAGAVTGLVSISVSAQEPSFIYQTVSHSVIEGSTVRLLGHTAAGPPAFHVLQFNGTNTPLPYTFDRTGYGGFTLLEVTLADAGDYRIIASNVFGMATSIVATLTVTPAGPLDVWRQRNPLPQSHPLLGVTYGNGLFVAVGEHGTIVTSTDGTNWFLQNRRVDLPLRGVAFGGGMFTAVGDAGTVLVSSDGTNWVYRYALQGIDWHGITFGNGRFVAVGDGAVQTAILTSTDGVDWQRTAASGVHGERGITFGNGLFIAVGSTHILRSSNGTNWFTSRSDLANDLEAVSFHENLFVAVGDDGFMLVSSDGIGWNTRNTGTTRRMLGVTHGNGKFVNVGSRGTILSSPDASTWSLENSATPDRLEAVTYGNGLFVAVGENGTIVTSPNGAAWTKQHSGSTRDLDGMALANGTIVVVGKGGSILTSTDGTHFSLRDPGVTNDLHGVAWGNGLWVAVGEPGIILTSSDTINWTSRPSGNSNSLKGLTYANGTWVVVGTQGGVVTSSNGVDWVSTTVSPPFDLNDVAYGLGQFLIAGDGFWNRNGSLFTSINGTSWTWASMNWGKNLRSILFTNGAFLITANDGLVLTSTNATSWQFHYLFGGNLRGATWAHGQWNIIGNFGYIFTTTNFATFPVLRPTRTFENLHDIVALNGTLIAIGNRGTILQSGQIVPVLEPPRFQPGVGATLAVKSFPGRGYEIQGTTNLVNWTNVFRFTNTVERTVFTDSNALSRPMRFYRAVQP